MRLRFWRRLPAPRTDEARQSAEAARRLLETVIGNRPRVKADVDWARGVRRRNHLTELFRGGNS